MAKKRYVVDFSVHLYVSDVVSADSRDDAEAIVDRLFDSELFLNLLQTRFIGKLHDAETFGESLEAEIAYDSDTNPEAVRGYDHMMAANEYLED